MKNKTLFLIVGIMAAFLSGCKTNQAAEAVKESEKIEKEGKNSESEETKPEEETEEEPEEEEIKVGILLPEDGTADQEFLEQKFQEAGYAPKILSAGMDAKKQLEQIQILAEEDVKAIVVDPVDAYAFSEAFASAEEKAIPIFAYDSLIMNTELVKYYAAFDTRAAGQLVGEAIVKMKGLEKAREEKLSYTIEFLMGAPEEAGELFFYNGILEVLQEYLDDGTLVCRSGKISFDDTSVMRGSEGTAKNKFRSISEEFYKEEGTPDIICTSSDKYTYAVAEFLETKGIALENENLPLITGFGSEAEAVKNVAEGKLGFTLFLDKSELADVCVQMVDGYLTGNKGKVDDYSQYDNGTKIIGTYTCEAKVIDKDNYQILVDNGTYREEEITPLTPTPAVKEEEETESEAQPKISGKTLTEEETKDGKETTEEITGTPAPTAEPTKIPVSTGEPMAVSEA